MVITEKSISDLAQHYLLQANDTAGSRVRKTIIALLKPVGSGWSAGQSCEMMSGDIITCRKSRKLAMSTLHSSPSTKAARPAPFSSTGPAKRFSQKWNAPSGMPHNCATMSSWSPGCFQWVEPLKWLWPML